MKWSEQVWRENLPIYNKILESPFIKELMDGTLAKEKFVFYIKQDAVYLAEYGKVLAGIASKLKKPEQIQAFLYFANDTMSVENALHETFFEPEEKGSLIEASPGCLFYTSYLHKQLANASIEVSLAAVLPCFWIYKEVGDYILANQVKAANPYQAWINTYGGEEYNSAVEKAISICDEIAFSCTENQRQAMTEAFIICSKMEWMFWDSAYKLEKWAV